LILIDVSSGGYFKAPFDLAGMSADGLRAFLQKYKDDTLEKSDFKN
jgi:hypothetical protein